MNYNSEAAEAFIDHLSMVSSGSVVQTLWNGIANWPIGNAEAFEAHVIEHARSLMREEVEPPALTDAALETLSNRIDAIIGVLPAGIREEARGLFGGFEDWFDHAGEHISGGCHY